MSKGIALVTGGAGFIGSHLTDGLLGLGYRVTALDNLLTGREENLAAARKHAAFTFVRHDITQPLPDIGEVDCIAHLASPASVIDYQRYPEETALTNSWGTIQMLRLAVKHRATFLLASTSEVYGDPKEHPQKETYWGNVNPNGVRSCYDESKRFAEAMTMVYVRKYNLNARIVRIFNTYGPRMRKNDGRVISNFVNQALEGTPITVYGDGTQTRSFCYVSDLVAGLVKAMTSRDAAGEVINLGNPEEYTVQDLAEKIKTMTHSSSAITHNGLPDDDPRERKPDIAKAQRLLGWEPTISVTDGLEKTIAYYRTLS
ncbi:SDR family oxidoreductase [Patescibacteria group bacterium]|nr:SDR family oxidoreductase [Patescibacteria group bacterium]